MTSARDPNSRRLLSKFAIVACVVAIPTLGAAASAAAAAPAAPVLSGTHPASPGTSTTPRIYGTVGGVGTSVVYGDPEWGTAGALDPHAEGETTALVQIYAQAGCGGSAVASGTVGEFQGPGIPVSVAPLSTTAFSATVEDESGTSQCSGSIEYRQVEAPPSSPSVVSVNPASPADNNSPRVGGVAEEGSRVAIFPNSSCSGTALASGSAAAFQSTGIAVPVADNTTTTFYARAEWAELPSSCSTSSVTYQEVTAAPPGGGGEETTTPPSTEGGGSTGGSGGSSGGSTGGGSAVGPAKPVAGNPPAAPSVRTAPGGRANDATPLLTGSAPRADTVQIFAGPDCSGQALASPTVAQFAAGVQVRVTPNSESSFSAKAINDAGSSHCSEPVSYFEDSTAPLTRITFGPGVKTHKRTAVFRFEDTADDPLGTYTFLCKFDKRPWRECQSPLKLPRLKAKAHQLKVKAVDAAGNEEATAQSRRFKVIGGGK